MSKFCEFCGATMEDSSTFCPACGKPVAQNETVNAMPQGVTPEQPQQVNAMPQYADNNAMPQGAPQNNASNPATDAIKSISNLQGKNKTVAFVGLGIVAVIVLVVLVVLLSSLLGGGYKKPLDNLCKAFNKEDSKYLEKAYGDTVYDLLEDTMSYYYDDMDDAFSEAYDGLEDEFGKDIKVTYKIKDKDKMDKDDLEDFEDNIKDEYDEKVKASVGYELEVEFTVKGKDDDDDAKLDVYAVKIDGKWCIFTTPSELYYEFA